MIDAAMNHEEFLTADFSFFEALVAEKREESTRLEFKRKSAPNQVELQRDDKKLLGEVISGFANASGGVLILGIDTEKVDGGSCKIDLPD